MTEPCWSEVELIFSNGCGGITVTVANLGSRVTSSDFLRVKLSNPLKKSIAATKLVHLLNGYLVCLNSQNRENDIHLTSF